MSEVVDSLNVGEGGDAVRAGTGIGGTGIKNLEELQEILELYNEVTQKLQGSHERLEQEVVRLREQLEEKNKELELKKRLAALGEMAAGIAHEIRNPLGGIQLYAGTLLEEVRDRPMAVELVKKISSGVKGLNVLVSDMLTFTRDMQLSKREEELSEIVLETLELAAPSLLEQDVSVRVHGSVEGKRVCVDRRLIARVLLNLVLNAAEAIGEAREKLEVGSGKKAEGGKVEIRAVQISTVTGVRTELLIEDNGPGIPSENLERIFDPFFTTKHTGTGLGLAIVHRIVESHGGVIAAENRREGGARIRMVI